jgi:hypothetical protein
MKRILYAAVMIAAASATLFLDGCKKTASVDGHILTHSISITSNGVVSNSSTTYQYDGQGRQILATPSTGIPTSTSYNGSTVTQVTGTTTVVYTLNNSGQAQSDNQGDEFSYSNGYLTNETNGTALSLTNQVTNGNTMTSTLVENGVTTVYVYQYLTTPDYRNFGTSFLGNRNTDLISSETVSGGSSGTATYTYQYDSHGRVIEMTLTAGGTYSEVHNYLYTTN